MWKQMLPGLRMTLLLTVLTGLIYPGVVTGLCQLLFPKQANGSLISNHGRVVGSELIGQNFSRPEYFSRDLRRPATTATMRPRRAARISDRPIRSSSIA